MGDDADTRNKSQKGSIYEEYSISSSEYEEDDDIRMTDSSDTVSIKNMIFVRGELMTMMKG